jgi:hypothetical protein
MVNGASFLQQDVRNCFHLDEVGELSQDVNVTYYIHKSWRWTLRLCVLSIRILQLGV